MVTYMFSEAAQASDALARQLALNSDVLALLARSLAADRPSLYVTCARGSSGHAASFFRYLSQARLDILACPFEPAIASVFGKSPAIGNGIGVVISQSGQSPDLIAFARRYRVAGNRIIALVNNPQSPLALAADFVVPLQAGKELSVAATKSFSASLFAALQLAAVHENVGLSLDDLQGVPDLVERAWAMDWSPLVAGLSHAPGLFVIGRGVGFAAAGEAALKLKETSSIHAEAFSAAEVCHGPMALLGEGFPVLIFRQDDETSASIDSFARLAVAKGCRVLIVGAHIPGATSLPCVPAPAVVQPLLQIQSFYRAANAIALERGMNPDRPANLQKVTETL